MPSEDSDPAAPLEGPQRRERAPHSSDGLRPAPESQLFGLINRLITEATAEADATVDRVRAEDQLALQTAHSALDEQNHRVNSLEAALQQCEKQIEDLRLQLLMQEAHTKAAREAYEAEHNARARSDEAAKADRQQLVSAHNSQLQAVRAELDATRAAVSAMKRQREAEASEHATLVAALKTVQHACAVVDSTEDTRVVCPPAEEHAVTAVPQEMFSATTSNDDCGGRDVRWESTPKAAHRGLKLVPCHEEEAPGVAPARLIDSLRELFEQIGRMHSMDSQGGDAARALDRLAVNLRCARDTFVQRASQEGVSGADLFEQELVARLDQLEATALGRHLAIAAYDLEQPSTPPGRAEAS